MLETWRRQRDGAFELDEDRFKIEEVFPAPRVATPEETVSILVAYLVYIASQLFRVYANYLMLREGPLICAFFAIRTTFGFGLTHPPTHPPI